MGKIKQLGVDRFATSSPGLVSLSTVNTLGLVSLRRVQGGELSCTLEKV